MIKSVGAQAAVARGTVRPGSGQTFDIKPIYIQRLPSGLFWESLQLDYSQRGGSAPPPG